MNRTELQKDFYKRFSVSSNNLVFSKSGLLCTLLGHSEIKQSEFISCTLSMCVQAAGRRLDSSSIKLENTQSGIYTIIHLNDCFSGKKTLYDIMRLFNYPRPFGAEILYDITIPQCFSHHASMRVTILNTLLKLARTENTEMQKAIICAGDRNPAPYAAILSAKKGWCTLVKDAQTKSLPFPLTGYKLLSVQTNARHDKDRTAAVEKSFNILHRIYPHVSNMNDLTFDMLDYAKSSLKAANVGYMRHIISENDRIAAAKSSLKACRINEFAEIMNSSQRSIERLWGCSEEELFLVNTILETNACLCARQWKNGIISIIEEDSIDYIINILRRTFSANFGYDPVFCVSSTCGTE